MFFERLLKKKGILTLMLSVAVLCGISPGNAIAMPVSSQVGLSDTAALANMEKIRSFLNRAIVQKKLAQLGLSKESAMEYLSKMDSADLARLAERVDTLNKGSGDGIVVLLVILLIAVCVLYFMDYKVKIEPRRNK